ncbi:heme biosynthesis HemY N-terminal domain-containing protein [Litorilituus lipolyticus]|uniref:Heme biosynthesis protein HemY n=1 Tax=Litorilituus lipolyticus TaxID=2491017 RepID=A0A502KVK8_9GAMM|nr:heme biosynthesis HemY N-terminal domain-containing protein [Litorilituus lipolyticus]TPH15678.1 heme biosynthesis protein HemY [Litorilituus lipolyticus]
MIRLILIAIAFFAVLAFSPMLIGEKGYILIAIGETTIESTVLSAIIMLIIAFIVCFVAFKVIKGGFKFSFAAWNTVVFASQRRGIANFNKALAAYMLEDYSQAEQLFAKSAIPSKRKQSAYLMAASASAKLALDDNTNHYLALLEQETSKEKELNLESVIIKVKLLMNQDNEASYAKAREIIDEHHKQIGHDARLLSLEIDLCLIEHRYQTAIDYLPAARKEKALSEQTIIAWENSAFYGTFNQIIQQKDKDSLHGYWQSIARKLKHRENILLAYCTVLAEQDITEPLNKLLVPLIKKSPSEQFLKSIRSLPIKQADELISIVQKHLHNNMQSAKWLSCLGHLAVNAAQWSMAEKAFGSLIKLEGEQYDRQDLVALAIALTNDKRTEDANRIWLKVHQL